MKTLTADAFMKYRFLSDLILAPESKAAAFRCAEADPKRTATAAISGCCRKTAPPAA